MAADYYVIMFGPVLLGNLLTTTFYRPAFWTLQDGYRIDGYSDISETLNA